VHDGFPRYADLCARRDAPQGSAWGVFGPDDQLGTLNNITAATRRRAAGLVKRGRSFGLDHSVGTFDPPVTPHRQPVRHTIVSHHGGLMLDDYLDSYYPQVSSQIDGLRHHRHHRHGFFGGVNGESVRAGSPALGIQEMAAEGIVGRGVLLDVQRYLAAHGRSLDYPAAEAFPVELLDDVARYHGVVFEAGDILLIRTGWSEYHLSQRAAGGTPSQSAVPRCCGLRQAYSTLEWIWDHRFAVVASDTIAVEAMPSVPDSPFTHSPAQMMHGDLIALLGVCLGELWNLDALAQDCAEDGVHEAMVVAKPINLLGGVGSPANAVAIK
jgi:kynurenine formamidase